MEVIDSRFSGFTFTMADAVADNGSSGLFTIGSVAVDPRGLGLAMEPGWVVLTGGMTDALPIGLGGRIAAHFAHLGSVVTYADQE